MTHTRFLAGHGRWPGLLATTAAGLILVACGGNDDNIAAPLTNPAPAAATVQLSGLAATGAAIANAQVSVVNANGVTASATTAAGGTFSVTIADGAPYALRVTDSAGRPWYSFAQAAGTANITPLTSLAMAHAGGNRPLADLYNGWASNRPTPAQVLEAARVVNANLASVMQARGVAAASTNFFTHTFSANGQGLDAVLDAIRVSFNCSNSGCDPIIASTSGTSLVTWNGSIPVTGITLSWSGVTTGGGGASGVGIGACSASAAAGSYSMVVQTTIAGLGSIPVPEVCVDGLQAKPSSQAEFCGGSLATGQLPNGVSIVSCSYDGNVGTIAARIATPVVLDYTIKYSFVQR